MKKIALSFSFLFSFIALNAFAADLDIVDCKMDMIGGNFKGQIKLSVEDSGKLYAVGGEAKGTLERFDDLMVYPIEPVDAKFAQTLSEINNYRDTGIDPLAVTHWQRIFINGNVDFHSDLYKVFDARGKHLGWLTSAIVLGGCYPN